MKAIILAGLMGIAAAATTWAQEHPEHPTKKATETPKSAAIEATVTGENICVGCALKEHGAAAQCSKYGHQHALRVTAASQNGKDMPEMKGVILYYLTTDSSQALLKEHHAEIVTVKGKIYPAERVLEVLQIEAPKEEHSEHPEHPEKK